MSLDTMLQIAFVNPGLTGNPISRNLLIRSIPNLCLDIFVKKLLPDVGKSTKQK